MIFASQRIQNQVYISNY